MDASIKDSSLEYKSVDLRKVKHTQFRQVPASHSLDDASPNHSLQSHSITSERNSSVTVLRLPLKKARHRHV